MLYDMVEAECREQQEEFLTRVLIQVYNFHVQEMTSVDELRKLLAKSGGFRCTMVPEPGQFSDISNPESGHHSSKIEASPGPNSSTSSPKNPKASSAGSKGETMPIDPTPVLDTETEISHLTRI